jgi:hypothetical protein
MEFFYHVAAPEIVLHEVGVVWACLLQELLEVVHGRLRLMPAAARSSHDARNAEAVHSLVVATVVIGRSCSLPKSLLAPLPASLGALPGVLSGDSGRRPCYCLRSSEDGPPRCWRHIVQRRCVTP